MWCCVWLFLVVSTSAIDCLERLVSEMTYYVSGGTLNPTHSLTHMCMCVCVCECLCAVIQYLSRNMTDIQLSQQQHRQQQQSAGLFEMSTASRTAANSQPPLVCTSTSSGGDIACWRIAHFNASIGGGGIMFLGCLSGCPSVCPLTIFLTRCLIIQWKDWNSI